MKPYVLIIAPITLILACSFTGNPAPPPDTGLSPSPTPEPTSLLTQPASHPAPSYLTPPNSTWHIQYTGAINISLDVAIYNLDLFDTDPAVIVDLQARDIFVMCYFSAGSFEDWRPDAANFPSEILGLGLEGWEGERWLDIRRIDRLAPIMAARLELAAGKGCDGVDPDNINGYTNETGFPLTYDDQLAYNIWLAQAAHTRGLSIGLKNDVEQIPDLVSHFDWHLNEECFTYGECDLLLPFIEAGKPVFQIEYELPNAEFCGRAKQLGFQSIRKHWGLDEFSEPCP